MIFGIESVCFIYFILFFCVELPIVAIGCRYLHSSVKFVLNGHYGFFLKKKTKQTMITKNIGAQ